MNDDKNLISNNGNVDEELLRGFFADSAHMYIATTASRFVSCVVCRRRCRHVAVSGIICGRLCGWLFA